MNNSESTKFAIVCYKVAEKKWRIRIDGVQHPSEFTSEKDCRLWCGAMQENGLYTGRHIFVESQTGALTQVEPMYV